MAKFELIHGQDICNTYPYGRMQCTRTIETEFKKNKGYRIKTQTTNPKTGRLNAPKYSTYYPFIILHREEETGHAKGLHFGISGNEEVQRFINFITEHKEELNFTKEESAELWANVITSLRVSTEWSKFKIAPEGEPLTQLDYLEAIQMKQMIKHYGANASILELANMGLDIPATMALYEDKENGQACRSYRIAGE
jgi:hypothetical protein